MDRLVSVIIPTYNRADYLPEAIRSALDQESDGVVVEVLVVDDGSTDNTEAVVGGFGNRIRYIRQENQREGAARNNGAAQASGAYLAFLDSDDYWRPGKLRTDLERLAQGDQPALVYSRAENVDPEGRVLGTRYLPAPQGDVLRKLGRENFIPLSSVVVRTDAFQACGGFVPDPDLSGTADWEMWMRLAARWPVGFSEQTATCIRVHPRNMLSNLAWMERSMQTALHHAFRDPKVAQRVGNGRAEVHSHMYVTMALNAYANNDRRRCLGWLVRAVATWPPQLTQARFAGALGRVVAGPRIMARVKSLRASRSSRR